MLVSCALVGMAVVFLSIPPALGSARFVGLFRRRQDPHHTHRQPVPRMGGLVLAIAFIVVELFLAVGFP